jgi:hypothetical protein
MYLIPMETKTNSKALDQVQLRLSTLKSIDPDLDLGGGLTIRSVSKLVENTRSEIDSYNTELSAMKQKYKDLRAKEGEIADLSDRIVDGIAFKFGRKSKEYEKIRSIRRNNRPRSKRAATAESAATAETVAIEQ